MKTTDPRRIWYSDADHDLYLYLDDGGSVEALEFCYDKQAVEHVLLVKRNQVSHMRIDAGEDTGMGHKRSPIHVVNGEASIPLLLDTLRVRLLEARIHNEDIERFLRGVG